MSPTTKRAKWINTHKEHEDRTGQSLAKRNHDVIKHRAEERKAQPATVPGTEHGDTLGVLRFGFAGYGGSRLEKVNWESWFKTFDRRKLAFVFTRAQERWSDEQLFPAGWSDEQLFPAG